MKVNKMILSLAEIENLVFLFSCSNSLRHDTVLIIITSFSQGSSSLCKYDMFLFEIDFLPVVWSPWENSLLQVKEFQIASKVLEEYSILT